MMDSVLTFSYGMQTALALVAALFFMRYWKTSGDRLFAFFAAAFVALGANWAALSLQLSQQHATYIYALRLIGFLILLAGIFDKSRQTT